MLGMDLHGTLYLDPKITEIQISSYLQMTTNTLDIQVVEMTIKPI